MYVNFIAVGKYNFLDSFLFCFVQPRPQGFSLKKMGGAGGSPLPFFLGKGPEDEVVVLCTKSLL